MQFVDIQAQQERIKGALDRRLRSVMDHGAFIMGPEVAELETRLQTFTGARHAVTCGSGTDALLLVLMAKGIGRGDAVFTTPFTFIATAEVISLLGATPVFVDIDPATFNIDPDALRAAVDGLATNHPGLRAAGVIAVDLFGLPADYDRIRSVAEVYGLFLLADAAQSFGARYKGRRVGTLADATATSFFPAKPLACFGDGGAIFTDDEELADQLRSLRVHGKGRDKYDNVRIGINSRLDTIQAAVLLAKLEIFEDELAARHNSAAQLSAGLNGAVTVPHLPDGLMSAWAQYSILAADRDALAARLKRRGIPTAVYYPKPLHMQGAFAGLGYAAEAFPNALAASRSILSLPVHPYLDAPEVEEIIAAVKDAAVGEVG